MTVAVRVVGRAGKRGIIPRLPTGDHLVSDVEAWVRAEYPDMVRSTSCHRTPSGAAALDVQLHPAAAPVTLTADDAGRVTVAAETDAAGPGYHTFVLRLLERLGEEQSVAWLVEDPEEPAAVLDAPASPDRRAIERAHLVALRRALERVRSPRTGDPGARHVGTPPGTWFAFEGALASPLGPRDETWLEAAVGNPAVAIDIRPWWQDATDGRYLLNRALCLMWVAVRWRAAATEDEREASDEVLRLLRKAYPLDPALPFPWREWKELRDLRGGAEPMLGQIEERAGLEDPERPRLGYRREPVVVVHEGWALEVPGTFAERRTDEEWWGGEAGRRITIAAVATDEDGRPMRPQAFLDRVAGNLGHDALNHEDGPVVGRGRLDTDASSGVSVGVLEGFSAVVGSGAAIRVEFDDPEDWQWALDQWRLLRPISMAPAVSRRP